MRPYLPILTLLPPFISYGRRTATLYAKDAIHKFTYPSPWSSPVTGEGTSKVSPALTGGD